MTGTDRIKAKILEDARAKALDIEERARREAREILNQASEEAGRKKAELLKKAEAEGTELYKRLLAVAGLEGRKEILRAKQDMIEAAFKAALEKIRRLPDHEYQKLLEEMVVKVAGNSGGEVLLSEKDAKRVDGSFIDNINRRLGSSGENGQLSLSKQNIKSSGGFILKCGEFEVNGTFEILLNTLRPELENDVARILFGG